MTRGSTIDGSIPGYYRKRIWSGADKGPGENAYSCDINEALLIPVRYGYGTPRYSGSMLTFRPVFNSYPTQVNNTLNRATIKVQEDLAQSKFHAGVFAGEFRESYATVSTIVKNIGIAITAAKRGRWDKAFRYLSMNPHTSSLGSVAANSYMMVHFGIMPMLSDAQAIYELMKQSYRVVKKVKKAAFHRWDSTASLNGVTWQIHYKCVAEVRGDVEMVELSVCDRLSCFDLAGVAWELTRLSWLADWIIPIGNFLSAVNASNVTTGANFMHTTYERYWCDTPENNGTYVIVPFDKGAFHELSSTRRAMTQGLPWSFPTISNPLGDNLSRWTTAAALLRQSVKSR